VVELIGKESGSAMSADVKGDAYEGLLEKNAQDVKGGAGQYFTPRARAARRSRTTGPTSGRRPRTSSSK
jgi:type I restriction enzyme M protein